MRVPRNVLILSIVSFFNDVAAEMIYPLVPIFLTSTLQAPVAIVGFIEGIAEFITDKNAGSYFGLYQTGLSLATFLASFIGGILWTIFTASATFYYGSAMALLAFLLLAYAKTFKKL